jgi:hypothetical protein
MRALLFALLVTATAACGGDDQTTCDNGDCACGPTLPCPTGFDCDPVSMICVRRATLADAGIDAMPPVPDAGPLVGTLTLTVYGASTPPTAGVPTAFADVVVGAADGSMVAAGKTNSSGVFTFPDFHEGMMVTVVTQSATLGVAQVLTDLAPGSLVLGDPQVNATRGPITVDIPSFAQAITYEVDNGCTRNTSNDLVFTLTTRDACISATNQVRVVAYAVNASGQRVAYSVTDTAYPPAGTIQAGTWLTDLASVAITPSDFPATGSVTATFTGRRSAVPRATYGSDALALTGTTLATLRFAPGAFDVGTTQLGHDDIVQPLELTRLLYRGHALAATGDISEPVSFATDFLGTPLMPMLDRTDEARPVATFGTPAPTYDMALVRLAAIRSRDPTVIYTYVIYAPPGTSSVKVPELPASLSAVIPTAADTFGDPVVLLMDLDTVAAYRNVLAQTNFLTLAQGAPPALGAAYTTRVSGAQTAPQLQPRR